MGMIGRMVDGPPVDCSGRSRAGVPRRPASEPALVTLSIVGTSDLHGAALPETDLGGLPLLAGYVNNLRAARASDGGAVLLIDSGDTFQGDVESNLSEGALVVDAYNAIGYTAEAIGNHDFDFGSVDSPDGATVAGRSARRSQGARGPGAVPLPRGEPDRRGDGPAGRVAERPAIGDRGRRRDQGRHRRSHDDRRAAVDPRGQRAGTADRAARRPRSPRRRRSSAPPAPTSSSSRRTRAGAASDSISPRICRRASPSRRSSAWREACRPGWWTSSPPATRTPGSRIRSTASASSSRSPAASRSAASMSSSIGGRGASRGSSRSRRTRSCRRQYEGQRRHERSGHRPGDGGGAPARASASGHTARRVPRCADSASRHASDRRWATSLPKRCAPQCRRGRGGRQQRGARTAGGSPRRPGHLRTAVRRVPVRQSRRADHAERSGARAVAGRRDPAGPSRLARDLRRRRASELPRRRPPRRSVPRARRRVRDEDRLVAVTIGAPTPSGRLASPAPLGRRRADRECSGGAGSGRGLVSAARSASNSSARPADAVDCVTR